MDHAVTIMDPSRSVRQRGVSIIEIAVVLSIVAILFTIAAPSFGAWIGNVKIRTTAESLQSGLQLARAEAIRRNRSVMFWLTAAGTGGADWMVACATPQGAGALPEAPGDCPGPGGTAQVPAFATVPPINWIQWQTQAAQQTTQVQLATLPANATEVTFNAMGLVTNNLDGTLPVTEIDLSDPAITTGARPLHVTIGGGSIRLCDPALALATDPRGCN